MPHRECRCIPGARHGRCANKAVCPAAQGSLRDRRDSAARPRPGENVRLGHPQGTARAAGNGDAARSRADLADRQRRSAGLGDGRRRQLQRRLGRRSASRSRRSTCTSIRSISPAPTRPASSGRSAPRCSAGKSATKSSSTATRTTATTRNAMAAIRCSRRRSASGATRRRTVPSRNSAACRPAN